MLWKQPFATVTRSGFEVVGYAMTRSKWTLPQLSVQRSGFEITGYAMAQKNDSE